MVLKYLFQILNHIRLKQIKKVLSDMTKIPSEKVIGIRPGEKTT